MEEFRNNDDSYQNWLVENPDGFVINTKKTCPTDYMVLHRVRCLSISNYSDIAKPAGGFTERKYIKICADTIEELEDWVQRHGGRSFSIECSMCKPR